MPDYTCPKCKNKFSANISLVVRCTKCRSFFKPSSGSEALPEETSGNVIVVPQPPSEIQPDGRASPHVRPQTVFHRQMSDNLPVLETKKTKIERIAAMKLTTAKYFSWCPREYVKGWLEASAKGTILQQGRLKQPPPYQGAGLYCVSSPMKSCMWADETKESVCLVIDMVNVPTICKHDIEQMQLLADPLNSISIDEAALNNNAGDDSLFLWTYGGSDGGFSRLTASSGVTVSADLTKVFTEEQLLDMRKMLGGFAAPRWWDAQIKFLKGNHDYAA